MTMRAPFDLTEAENLATRTMDASPPSSVVGLSQGFEALARTMGGPSVALSAAALLMARVMNGGVTEFLTDTTRDDRLACCFVLIRRHLSALEQDFDLAVSVDQALAASPHAGTA